MPIGWFDDLANAELYFTTERLETGAWDDLSTAAKKTKAVINAYNRIYHDPDFSVPTYAAATAAQLIKLKIANGEMAYYLALHLSDEDERKGRQAQAVTAAGIIHETYDKDMLGKLPIPAAVKNILEEFYTPPAPFYASGIDRCEDDAIDEGEGT